MAHKRKDTLTAPRGWEKHYRKEGKRMAAKAERRASRTEVAKESADLFDGDGRMVVRSRVWIKQPNFWRGWHCVCSSTRVLSGEEARKLARCYEGMTDWKLTTARKGRDG